MRVSQDNSRKAPTGETSQSRAAVPSLGTFELSAESFAPKSRWWRLEFESARSASQKTGLQGNHPEPHLTPPVGSSGGWQYHATIALLNSKIFMRSALYLGAYGTLLTQSLPPLIDGIPGVLIVGGVGDFVYHYARHTWNRHRELRFMVKREESWIGSPEQRERIMNITRDLCEGNKIPMPIVCVEAGAPRIYNRLLQKDILCIPSGLAEAADDRELRAVIAHELAHVGNTELQLNRIEPLLQFCAFPAVLSSVVTAMQPVVAQHLSLYSSYAIAGLSAAVAWQVGTSVAARLLNWNQQDAELRTDLRSVRYTRDPEGSITALQKDLERLSGTEEQQVRVTEEQEKFARRGRVTHPSHRSRIEGIRKLFLGSLG